MSNDHSIHEMDELMQPPDNDDDEWEDDEWEDEFDDGEVDNPEVNEKNEEKYIQQLNNFDIPPVPITPDGDVLEKGDTIKIVGDIEETRKHLFAGRTMELIINNERIYQVNSISKEVNSYIVNAAGWNWGIANIRKIKPDDKVLKKDKIFHYDSQYIDID